MENNDIKENGVIYEEDIMRMLGIADKETFDELLESPSFSGRKFIPSIPYTKEGRREQVEFFEQNTDYVNHIYTNS